MFEPRVVAALDFGTHGTGFAWAVVEPGNADPHSRRIHFCNRWEAQPVACAKNLSALLLSPEGDVLAWGFDARRRFLTQGRKSTPGALSYHAGFKMALLTKPVDAEDTEEAEGEDEQTGDRRRTDSTDEVADADDDSDIEEDEEDSLPGDSATPALITAYLRKVYARALEQITASGYSEDEIRWCLTIPAIWSDYQKQVMRDVAKNAGFPTEDGRLILALEPEAAAHYARVCGVSIASGDGSPADLMTAGARFMVADCGGGTVDITAYENDSAGRMVEIGRVNGGRLGSDYLNRAFEDQFLVSRFGGAAVLQELREEYPEALLDLTDAWERAKLHIGVDQQEPIYLNIPSAIDRHLGAAGRRRLRRLQDNVCDAIVITAAEVRSLFDNVVPDILELIDDQLDEMRQSRTETSQSDVVLLVGGFSTSPTSSSPSRIILATAPPSSSRRTPTSLCYSALSTSAMSLTPGLDVAASPTASPATWSSRRASTRRS
ncbi:Hsp70 family protein [Kitasatospora gansuensis]